MGTMRDLKRHGITLREGLILHLYMDDAMTRVNRTI
jgi:hypothetical protein